MCVCVCVCVWEGVCVCGNFRRRYDLGTAQTAVSQGPTAQQERFSACVVVVR